MYPVLFDISRAEKSSRLLLFLRPFMLFPLMFWAVFYAIGVQFVTFLAFWGIMFTGKYPRSMWDFTVRYFRFSARINGYSMFLCDVYPPFNGREETPYPIRVRLSYPGKMSRLNVFFRFLLLIPHFFYVFFYGIAAGFILFLTFWAVLFSGRIPDSFRGIITRYFIYISRLNAYVMLLVDEYPPFHGAQPLAAEAEFESTAPGD